MTHDRFTTFLRQIIVFLVIASSSLFDTYSRAEPLKLAQSNQRIMFLGDSITNDGHYIVLLEAQLQQLPDPPELINLGLPSETCCGLSEPTHPFPRPDVHERLDRALEVVKPDIVYVCYGMNDAIYHPFDEERFKKYQAGVTQLIAKCQAAGIAVRLMTPPPFDPQPLRRLGKLRPADAKEFDWRTPYEKYDEVIEKYAKWVMSQQDQVDEVLDLLHPIKKYVADKRGEEPDFALSKDGVHINTEGHQVLANAIMQQYQVEVIPSDPKLVELLSKRQNIMHAAWLTKVGHKRPGVAVGLPMPEAIVKAAEITKQISELAMEPIKQ